MKSLFAKIKSYITGTDKLLLLLSVFASGIGCFLLYALKRADYFSSFTPFITQLFSLGLGVIFALILSSFDYHTLAKLWPLHLPVATILVALTFTPLGIMREGSDDKAWLDLKFITIQPSEFLKLSFILTFAFHLFKVKDSLNRFKNVLFLCLHGAVFTLLTAAQGDLGSALVFFFIFICMLLSAGLSWKYYFPFILVVLIASPFAWMYLPDYLKQRFYVAWDPSIDPYGMGMQQLSGRTALGSGGLLGNGIAFTKPVYVPEMHNDFIFSYIGQCFGFVGCIICLCLLGGICLKTLAAARKSKDPLGSGICVGVFAIIMFQSIINIGMVLCALPVIGITLPFFSAGGSSLITVFLAIGLVLSVSRQNRKKQMFSP